MTKSTVIFIVSVFIAVFCGIVSAEEQNRKIYMLSEDQLDRLLPELHTTCPLFNDRLAEIVKLYLGASYCTDPLTAEETNWFPHAKPNCTMLVLYAAALANGKTYAGAREHMRLLHYRGGAVGFAARYHFTSDRITDEANRYFNDITAGCVKNPVLLQPINLTLNKKKDGSSFFGGRLGNWSREVTVRMVSRKGFSMQNIKQLSPIVGVAFVKKVNFDKGIIVGHEGLLIDGDLYHASPGKGVVVVKDYLAGEFAASSWTGLLFFSINEIGGAVSQEAAPP
ncbi:MAG: DUF1460 domain-containing protein [Deltaproteobacteria bacterium]|nr:DUF1460 domain-containing protein [Deltaproteobacteria bacterium]